MTYPIWNLTPSMREQERILYLEPPGIVVTSRWLVVRRVFSCSKKVGMDLFRCHSGEKKLLKRYLYAFSLFLSTLIKEPLSLNALSTRR